jgi:hypothetical protein
MLNYEEAGHCYELICASGLHALRNDLFRKGIEYARIRTQWHIATREQRLEMDQRRTLAHNAFIDSCNILSRNMAKADEDNSWRAELGDDRKVIGDFACFIHCFLGLAAR